MNDPTAGVREGAAPVTENDARRELVDACLRMHALGLGQGNASMRWDRGGDDGFLITPVALPCEQMQVGDIVWISLRMQGEGEQALPACRDTLREPSPDWRMHRDVYADRANVRSVVHAYAPHAASLSCSARVQRDGIPPFHYRVAIAGGRDIRCASYASFGTQTLSDHALRALHDRRACLLANQGLLCIGSGLAQALALAVEVEALAQMYWQGLQLGDLVLLDDAEMQAVALRLAQRG